MSDWDLAAAVSGIHLSFVSLWKRPNDVTTPPPHLHRKIKKAKSPSEEDQGSNLKPPEQDEYSSELEKEDEISLSQL